jgi:hypothetical protein
MPYKKLTVFLGINAVALTVAVGVGASTGFMHALSVSALAGSTGRNVNNPSDNASLADAVTRWNAEHPANGPGAPLLSEATDLLSNVGAGNDTLSAFPTQKGSVCYQILAAGTCGSVDTPTGITFSILSTRDAGTRLFGVASDRVTRVEVVIDGIANAAILRENGFYFQLPKGTGSNGVQRVISTLGDGSTHTVEVHG